MSLRSKLRDITYEFLAGKRKIEDCNIDGVRWFLLRRVLLATKAYNESLKDDQKNTSFLLLEKKRAESKLWIEAGIKWPDHRKESTNGD